MTDPSALDRLLMTDPADVGCAEAMDLLHVYVDLVVAEGRAEAVRRHPGIAAHLRACGPCDKDFAGLLVAVETGSFDTGPPR